MPAPRADRVICPGGRSSYRGVPGRLSQDNPAETGLAVDLMTTDETLVREPAHVDFLPEAMGTLAWRP